MHKKYLQNQTVAARGIPLADKIAYGFLSFFVLYVGTHVAFWIYR